MLARIREERMNGVRTWARYAWEHDSILSDIARVLFFLESLVDEVPKGEQDADETEEETIPS